MPKTELTMDSYIGPIMVADDGEIEAGKIYTVTPDFGCHLANNALYEFRVDRISEPFDVVHDICVADEDYSYDGLRPIKEKTVSTVYGFGEITGRDGDCRW